MEGINKDQLCSYGVKIKIILQKLIYIDREMIDK